MGDISVIARRLKDGHVQHGWSGNGGYYRVVGARLLEWYKDPEKVEYLFNLGQLQFIGAPGSERGGYSFINTHALTGKPHYLGMCEDDIYSKIAFIDYAYFYDSDNKWYYIWTYGFSIKIPLELISYNLDERGYEFDFLKQLRANVFKYICNDYAAQDGEFKIHVESKGYELNKIYEDCMNNEDPFYEFVSKYEMITEYFDSWIVVEIDEKNTEVVGFKIKKDNGEHIETCDW